MPVFRRGRYLAPNAKKANEHSVGRRREFSQGRLAHGRVNCQFRFMNDPVRLLQSAEAILLVDWPNPGVPRALVESGRAVFGYSPSGYSKAEIVEAPPAD